MGTGRLGQRGRWEENKGRDLKALKQTLDAPQGVASHLRPTPDTLQTHPTLPTHTSHLSPTPQPHTHLTPHITHLTPTPHQHTPHSKSHTLHPIPHISATHTHLSAHNPRAEGCHDPKKLVIPSFTVSLLLPSEEQTEDGEWTGVEIESGLTSSKASRNPTALH